MNSIKNILFRNIEENIAPVIYFHQVSPEVAAQEVEEYVFTSRPSSQGKQQGGIHEQMVHLLNQITKAIDEGHKLPASWISGFFGSGKSSFAKLLGLALDKMVLPDGRCMDEALIARDDTVHFSELKEAFQQLSSKIDSMAVIFDIGSAAKNNESIPHTIYREILRKLGYSALDGVAHYELVLEAEGTFDKFLSLYREQYGKEWKNRNNSGIAPNQFRTIYKKIYPEQEELLEITTFNLRALSIQNLVGNLLRALERRALGKTVFIVVDEVSQYIAGNQNKMLDLQSFVSEIGGKAKPGRSPLWLLVTGQEKLEEESKDSVLFKLKDRFPEELRVHLDRANVREVVSRRILKKKSPSELDTYITDGMIDKLKLQAYGCEQIGKKDLIEHYPLLPKHIPLFMDITQNIRNRSIRTQSDAGGVRSVLNNIWDLFNVDPVVLKDKELGTLLTIDMLYDVIGSSVDSDIQMTLFKVFEKYPAESWEQKVIKAIALLEMDYEKNPVTTELISSLLYPALGKNSVENEVKEAMERLRKDNWIHFHEKNGWSIQNNAAQEWARIKSEFSIPEAQIAKRLIDLQKDLLSSINQPTLAGARFPIEAYWDEQKILGRNNPTCVRVIFHWERNSSRRKYLDTWLNLSRKENEAFHFLCGETTAVENKIREYERSERIIHRYRGQGQLQPLQQQLLYREQSENDRLIEEIKKDLRQVWLIGHLFFNGDTTEFSSSRSSFDATVKMEIEKKLSQLYPKFTQGHISLQESEYRLLLEKDVSGLSRVFFEGPGQLGIAVNDAGKILFRCQGQVPNEIYQKLEEKAYLSGYQLVQTFGAPPYGYSVQIIKACIIGLLREERIHISDDQRNEITSIRDPGARSIFEKHRDFLHCEIEINQEVALTGRDRNLLRKFFEKWLSETNVDSDSDALADLVFKHFATWKDRISRMSQKILALHLQVPGELTTLNQALTECLENRQVQEVLKRFKRNIETIDGGMDRLLELEESLNEDTESELRQLINLRIHQIPQLDSVENTESVGMEIRQLEGHLDGTNPWRGWADIKPLARKIREHYNAYRETLAVEQQRCLDEQINIIKIRPDYSALSLENQQTVLQLLRKNFIDVDVKAIAPSLLQVKQAPQRIKEAASEAHKLIDELGNEEHPTERKITSLSLGLRNRIIENPEELDQLLGKIRKRCLQELESGVILRLEE